MRESAPRGALNLKLPADLDPCDSLAPSAGRCIPPTDPPALRKAVHGRVDCQQLAKYSILLPVFRTRMELTSSRKRSVLSCSFSIRPLEKLLDGGNRRDHRALHFAIRIPVAPATGLPRRFLRQALARDCGDAERFPARAAPIRVWSQDEQAIGGLVRVAGPLK